MSQYDLLGNEKIQELMILKGNYAGDKVGQYDLLENEKFLGLMILKENFRKDVINAVRTNDQQALEEAFTFAGITLNSNQITTIMGWPVDDEYWSHYFNVMDICKQAYDPGITGCAW